ncbi:MAG: lytic transglycosylase domain-containing protein [Clostridia bacterium]|nr:lytic transglycosylase domain-containing protein [Clostridia bacterium]
MPKQLRKIFFGLVLLIVIAVILIKTVNIKDFIMKKMYPKEYSQYVYTYAEENDLDPLLIFAVIKAESNFDSDVVSHSNAMGLMQILERTAKEVVINEIEEEFSKDMLFNPEENIKIGTKYFSRIIRKI